MANKSRVGVEVRNKNLEKALRIFKKKVASSGVLYQYRQNQEFKKPSTKRREQLEKAKFEQKSYDRKHILPDLKIKGHNKS